MANVAAFFGINEPQLDGPDERAPRPPEYRAPFKHEKPLARRRVPAPVPRARTAQEPDDANSQGAHLSGPFGVPSNRAVSAAEERAAVWETDARVDGWWFGPQRTVWGSGGMGLDGRRQRVAPRSRAIEGGCVKCQSHSTICRWKFPMPNVTTAHRFHPPHPSPADTFVVPCTPHSCSCAHSAGGGHVGPDDGA